MSRERLPIGKHGKIFLTRTESGAWKAAAYYRGYDGKIRRAQKTRRLKSEAELDLRDYIAGILHAGSGTLTPYSKILDAAMLWESELETRNLAHNTLISYRNILNKVIIPAMGNITLIECTAGRIYQLIRTLPPGQARMTVAVLSQVLELSRQHDAVAANPARGIKLHPHKVKHKKALSVEEVSRLRKILRGNCLLACDVMLGTAARPGEACAIRRWEDIEETPAGMLVHLRGAIVGYGADAHRSDRRKNGKTLSMYVPEFTAETIRSELAIPSDNPLLIYTNNTPSGVIPSNSLASAWRSQVKGTEFEGVTPHAMRATVATLLSRTESLEIASAQLGHSSISVTENFYVEKADMAPNMAGILQVFA